LKFAFDNPGFKTDPYSFIITEHVTFPPFWNSGLQLSQCLETPLHHIALGIVKKAYSLWLGWMASRKIRTEVGKSAVVHMETVRRSVPTDWFRLIPFAGGDEYTTGGWVGDHHVAFARYLPAFSVILRSAALRKNFVDDPSKMKELSSFEFVCDTLHCLVARLLTRLVVSVEEIDDHIKVFLSAVSRFDDLVNSDKTKRVLLDTANFLSLLHLPDQIRNYGPLHVYWEGNRERFIQQLKPMLTKPRWSASYLKNRLEKLHRETELTEGTSDLNAITEEDDDISSNTRRCPSLKAYKDLNEVRRLLMEGQPLVAAFLPGEPESNRGDVVVMHKAGRRDYSRLGLVCLEFSDDDGSDIGGRWWSPVRAVGHQLLSNAPQRSNSDSDLSYFLSRNPEFCVLIPLPPDVVVGVGNLYYVSTVEWRQRTRLGAFSLPLPAITHF
jgi:hypothetical protein